MIRIVPAPAGSGGSISIGSVVGGGSANRILYLDGATTLAQSANLTYSDTLVNSGPGLQVGVSNGTSAGVLAGYAGASGWSGIVQSGSTLDTGPNFRILFGPSGTFISTGSSTVGNSVILAASGTTKLTVTGTAGFGAYITAGTATTDVQALSATQTMNAAAVAFTGVKCVFTEGVSGTAAGTSLIDLQYGTSGAESTQFKVRKDGLITTGGTAAVASGTFTTADAKTATIKNGLIVSLV